MQRRKERARSKCKTVLEALLYIFFNNKNMKQAVKLNCGKSNSHT